MITSLMTSADCLELERQDKSNTDTLFFVLIASCWVVHTATSYFDAHWNKLLESSINFCHTLSVASEVLRTSYTTKEKPNCEYFLMAFSTTEIS